MTAGPLILRAWQRHLKLPAAPYRWPFFQEDPNDEPLVQLAQESGALIIITHNTQHLQPAVGLGIQVLKPNEFLCILQQLK
jgi:predicted nucleic acid-binding protein